MSINTSTECVSYRSLVGTMCTGTLKDLGVGITLCMGACIVPTAWQIAQNKIIDKICHGSFGFPRSVRDFQRQGRQAIQQNFTGNGGDSLIAKFFLSLLLIHAARAGSLPKLNAGHLVSPTCTALGIMGISSTIAGLIGYYKAKHQNNLEQGAFTPWSPMNKAVHWARKTGTYAGDIATAGLCAWMIHKRLAMATTVA